MQLVHLFDLLWHELAREHTEELLVVRERYVDDLDDLSRRAYIQWHLYLVDTFERGLIMNVNSIVIRYEEAVLAGKVGGGAALSALGICVLDVSVIESSHKDVDI